VALVTKAHKENVGSCFCSTSQVLIVVANAGQNEPGATNALVGCSVHWMGYVFSFSAPYGVHHSPFLFVVDHCTFFSFFWFLAVYPLDLTCYLAHFPTVLSTAPTLVPYL
jgi:hypothetical protein